MYRFGGSCRMDIFWRPAMRVVAAISALAATLLALSYTVPADASTDGIPAVLGTGRCLTANVYGQGPGAERESLSGVFTLSLTGDSVQLQEDESFPDGFAAATVDWWQFLYPARLNSYDKSKLCMRTNGDLVLSTSKGKVIWSSHTAGTGHHNSVRLENDGNLVMYNGRGKAVWSTDTTRTIMIAGTTLRSGAHLVYRYRQQFGITPTWLIMQRSGDLVLKRGSQVIWSTRTHVKGAHAALLRDGDLVVYSPVGKVLWQSHTRGHDAFLELNCSYMSLLYRTSGTSWNAPAGSQPSC
jgi:hypothetical protein